MCQRTAKKLPFGQRPNATEENDGQIQEKPYSGCNGGPPMDCNQRFLAVENRLTDVENRLGNVENRLGNVEKEVKSLSNQVDSQYKGFRALVITLIIAVIGVWYLIDQRQESWIQHSHTILQNQIDRNNEANRDLLEQFDRRNAVHFQNLQRQIDRIDQSQK